MCVCVCVRGIAVINYGTDEIQRCLFGSEVFHVCMWVLMCILMCTYMQKKMCIDATDREGEKVCIDKSARYPNDNKEKGNIL